MTRVDHWASIRHRPTVQKFPTVEVTQADDDIPEIEDVPEGPFLAQRIMKAVAAAHKISFREMISHKRERYLFHARWHSMWLVRKRTKLSLPKIAQLHGAFDHSTVVHALRRHEERMGKRPRVIVMRPIKAPKGTTPTLQTTQQLSRAIQLWKSGQNTMEIALRLQTSEAAVYNSLSNARGNQKWFQGATRTGTTNASDFSHDSGQKD